MADVNQYMNNNRVLEAVQRVQTECRNKKLSDIIDDADNQYVDLVMEGGGVLGIALIGYTYVLEKAGIRFLGLGGTSAGSINALMIAALGPPAVSKSQDLLRILADMPMAKFIDGDADARDFSHAVLEKASMTELGWKAWQVIDNLKEDLGLNPGEEFLNWLMQQLRAANIHTNADLTKKLQTVPSGLRLRNDRSDASFSDEDKYGRLVMVAADITTETKVEFPKMAKLYWKDPDGVDPACFARASMSIPFFFRPYRVDHCPQDAAAWKDLAGYTGASLPTSVMFMDGGIMSNFPINLFHQPYRIPSAPTFGAKIGTDRQSPKIISKPSQLLSAIFDAARHTLDFDFIKQNPDYKHLVKMIDTGDHNWLNFAMTEEDKVDLFARGAEAAADFLCGFEWDKYKKIRKGIAVAFLASQNNGV